MTNFKGFAWPCILLLIASIPSPQAESETTPLAKGGQQAIYFRGSILNEALLKLNLSKNFSSQQTSPYEPESIYKYDFDKIKLLKSDRNQLLLNKIASSPSGKWIVEANGKRKRIVDINGKEVANLGENCIEYVWNPRGDKIAYITGEFVPSDTPPLNPSSSCRGSCPKGVWIYDLNNNSEKKLDITAHLLFWADFDNNLYMDTTWREGNIIRYNPNSGKLEQTPYKGLNFSPDGKYYIVDHYGDGDQAHFYQREPHHHLTEIEQDIANRGNLYTSIRWLGDSHSILTSDRYSPTRFIVFDIDKAQFTKSIEGAYLGLNRAKTHAVFMTGIDQFKVVDLLAP